MPVVAAVVAVVVVVVLTVATIIPGSAVLPSPRVCCWNHEYIIPGTAFDSH